MRGFSFAAGMIAAVLLAAGPAAARSAKPAFVPLGAVADAPAGWVRLCATDPAACGLAAVPAAEPIAEVVVRSEYFTSGAITRLPSSGDPVPAAPAAVPAVGDDVALADLAGRINTAVNRRTVQRSDLKIYGVDELWRAAGSGPGAVGDCEDLALEKRAQLLAAGVPAHRLVLATVFRSGVGLHTVLVLRRDTGDFVLDSRTNRMLPWARARYSWLRLQSAERPMEWYRVAAA